MSIEYRHFKVKTISKCPECRNFGEKEIRQKGNNQYMYYYHRVGDKIKTCYIGKVS